MNGRVLRGRGRARGDRGIALITALFIMFAVAMMLFGFSFFTQNEVGFATASRDSGEALALAEAGIQESLNRLSNLGAVPGSTVFKNSLVAGSASCSNPPRNCVIYESPVASLSGQQVIVFPILSTATFGAGRALATRWVRVFEQATLIQGFGRIVYGPQVTFQGDASPIQGDTYSQTSIFFASWAKSPQCASGDSGTNLLQPQVMAGTYLYLQGGGNNQNTQCPNGFQVHNGNPAYTAECTGSPQTEVAPTPCPGGSRAVPFNWHPLTPIGMAKDDFTALITWINANPSQASTWGLSSYQATQNNVGVTYTPNGTYTPSYWSSIPSTSGKVMVTAATQPFCVNPTSGGVQLPSPPVTGTCPSGYHYYGSNDPTYGPQKTRYLDWGLVADDLTRGSATTFFQAPSCAAPCANAGNQNGIRYIPLLPTIPVLTEMRACQQFFNPGLTAYLVQTGDGVNCSAPIQQAAVSNNVSFTGTKSNPEALLIDDQGYANPGGVTINGSLGTGGQTCSNTNFDNYNWGYIFATGDITLPANTIFTGFIYTPWNIFTNGTVLVQGGIFSANVQGQSGQVNQVDSLGNVNFCTGQNPQIPISSQFFTFKTLSWQDRPLNQP